MKEITPQKRAEAGEWDKIMAYHHRQENEDAGELNWQKDDAENTRRELRGLLETIFDPERINIEKATELLSKQFEPEFPEVLKKGS